ncbi:glutathione-dependent formaldehyde-activating, GFA [Aulographum hederae CBS 113979]|uniref:Glutathione-dependent formaldehyde-activating, GFA n=1 Tax=Aulographum hederae CBS 113979 TaxID=1176131 RepID=A0A6G1H6X5_9PEZI|nr:glutathione-dependent formaldehyde-activating, GFA [Aulographum hederae CBS 113979]
MDVACQCGAVRFKTPLEKPLNLYHCHCTQCQKQSASAFGTSAIFPPFELPPDLPVSCYTRPTEKGYTMKCYFCKSCGVRVLHASSKGTYVSVKAGCIEGLDWAGANHIWTESAVIPIPEGAVSYPKEPTD